MFCSIFLDKSFFLFCFWITAITTNVAFPAAVKALLSGISRLEQTLNHVTLKSKRKGCRLHNLMYRHELAMSPPPWDLITANGASALEK